MKLEWKHVGPVGWRYDLLNERGEIVANLYWDCDIWRWAVVGGKAGENKLNHKAMADCADAARENKPRKDGGK